MKNQTISVMMTNLLTLLSIFKFIQMRRRIKKNKPQHRKNQTKQKKNDTRALSQKEKNDREWKFDFNWNSIRIPCHFHVLFASYSPTRSADSRVYSRASWLPPSFPPEPGPDDLGIFARVSRAPTHAYKWHGRRYIGILQGLCEWASNGISRLFIGSCCTGVCTPRAA